jgi:hypothetical protein
MRNLGKRPLWETIDDFSVRIRQLLLRCSDIRDRVADIVLWSLSLLDVPATAWCHNLPAEIVGSGSEDLRVSQIALSI